METPEKSTVNVSGLMDKLKADVTVTAPGWVFAAGTLVVLVLLGVAFD